MVTVDKRAAQRWLDGVPALAVAGVTVMAGVWLAGLLGLGPVDDAFISLRYAQNWAEGRGLCFNPGERVEGYTNFLLVAIEAAGIWLGADPVVLMKAVGWGSLGVLAGVFALFALRHLFGGDPVLSMLAGMAVALNPILLCWGASGMESCLYAVLVWASVGAALGSAWRHRVVYSALLLVLAAMTRPEGAALLGVLLLVVYFRERSLRAVRWYALIFVGGYGAYFLARWSYFGYLFPNTFYAKLDYGNAELLARGVEYLWGFVRGVPALMVMSGLAACLAVRSAPAWVKAFALTAGAQAALVVYEGGDHFALYRFMVPVVPLLSALALYPVVWVRRRFGLGRVGAAVAGVMGIAALGVSMVTVSRQVITEGSSSITQFDRFRFESKLAEQWTEIGRFLRSEADRHATLSTMGIGAMGYYSGLRIIDPLGIVDPVIAHGKRRADGGAAGHDKFDNAYVLGRKPSYILLVSVLTPQAWPREVQRRVLGERVQRVNLDMFNQPGLDGEYRFENVRLGGGYLNVYVRNDVATPG